MRLNASHRSLLQVMQRAVILTILAITAPSNLFAQSSDTTQRPVSAAQLGKAVAYYYERPFDVPKFLTEWERLGSLGTDATTGFLVGVFTKEPNRTQPIVSAKLQPQTQTIVIDALQLARRTAEAKAAATQWGWSAERISKFIVLPQPIQAVRLRHPKQFDIMWGASFATGDASYVRPIYEFYAAVSEQQGTDVRDIVTVVSNEVTVRTRTPSMPQQKSTLRR